MASDIFYSKALIIQNRKMPFKQKRELEFAKAVKRTPDELKSLIEKIEAKEGNWKTWCCHWILVNLSGYLV